MVRKHGYQAGEQRNSGTLDKGIRDDLAESEGILASVYAQGLTRDLGTGVGVR